MKTNKLINALNILFEMDSESNEDSVELFLRKKLDFKKNFIRFIEGIFNSSDEIKKNYADLIGESARMLHGSLPLNEYYWKYTESIERSKLLETEDVKKNLETVLAGITDNQVRDQVVTFFIARCLEELSDKLSPSNP